MSIEPHVFVCYGRPDKDAAYALAHEFWKNQIECYNYLAKPVEDRLGTELDHRGFLKACRLFVALLSPESITRYLVAEEIIVAARWARLSRGRFCQCRAYVETTTDLIEGGFPDPDLLFTAQRLADIAGLVREMTDHMGPEFAGRARKAWAVNKGLYPEAWAALDAMYALAPKPPPRVFTPARNSVFGDESEPTIAELKALGRSRLNRLRLDVAERRDNLRRIYGDRESFRDWSLRRDGELIETALQEIQADGGEAG
jgi:hypothetical protein